MAKHVSSFADATSDIQGIYRIDGQPTPGLGYTVRYPAGVVASLPWGPMDTVTKETNPGTKEFFEKWCPGACDAGLAYPAVALLRNLSFNDLRIVRPTPTGVAAVAYQGQLSDTGVVKVLQIEGLYKGALLNANCYVKVEQYATTTFDISFKIGNHGETYRLDKADKDASDYYPTVGSSIIKLKYLADGATTGRPGDLAWTLLSTPQTIAGTDGTTVIGDYDGTPGSADAGLALFELADHDDVKVVFADNPFNAGDSITLNGYLKAHTLLMGNRLCVGCGVEGETSATALTNEALMNHKRSRYAWSWLKQTDNNGADEYVPPTGMLACLMANLPASVGTGCQKSFVRDLQSHITGLKTEASMATLKNLNAAGVTVWNRVKGGGYSCISTRTTSSTLSEKNDTSVRMADYIAEWATETFTSLGSLGGPHARVVCDQERQLLEGKLISLKKDGTKLSRLYTKETIKNYAIVGYSVSNSVTDEQNGDHIIDFMVETFAPHEHIILSMTIGETVDVTVVEPE